jgi:hypothetical protein
MAYPSTTTELLEQIARETARMSYPGGMSRGKKPVVRAGTKRAIEEYFTTLFPLADIWQHTEAVARRYDQWHNEQTRILGRFLTTQSCLASPENDVFAVAAKFLNTFMHQLMKYERFRPLWQHLHLPLDARVFESVNHVDGAAGLSLRKAIGSRRAYALSPKQYAQVQAGLWGLVEELNSRPGQQFEIRSRIELNFLWL